MTKPAAKTTAANKKAAATTETPETETTETTETGSATTIEKLSKAAETETDRATARGSEADTGHLDEILTGTAEEPGAPDEIPAPAPAGEFVTKDEFYANFRGMHLFGAKFSGLNALQIREEHEEQARSASDAIYDTAIETPWLHFLIKPGGKWVQRGWAIVAYGMVLQANIKAERQMNARLTEPEPVPQSDAPSDHVAVPVE